MIKKKEKKTNLYKILVVRGDDKSRKVSITTKRSLQMQVQVLQ